MARTISEIKQAMTAQYIADPVIIERYNLDTSKTFDQQFSPVSLESVFFYIVAAGIWMLETLFDVHKRDINTQLLNLMLHTRKWYKTKVLQFQFPNRTLISDTDRYDNSQLTDVDIEALQVVKYCAVSDQTSQLLIKVAKGEPGAREPISQEEAEGLEYYLNEIRDAGVNIVIVNQQADKLFAEIEIYYNPLELTPSARPVETAMKQYVSNLEFNGALTTTGLVDALQAVPGVMLVNIITCNVQRSNNPREPLGVQKIADSGYWIVQNDQDLTITYKLYVNDENL